MNQPVILKKLNQQKLCGRGGAGFPTGKKWEMFWRAKAEKKYIICNASEGDPQVKKDKFILEHYADEVVGGIKLALESFPQSKAYLYLKKDYYQKFQKKLLRLTKGLPIVLFKKPGDYLAGEETSILEAIEGRRPEPRFKPPYPIEQGLFNEPTLINNVETFYFIAKISQNAYKNERFYSVSGDVKNPGVFILKEGLVIEEILRQTGNLPKNNRYFVQAGGSLGEFFLPEEINGPFEGLASIVVYNSEITNPFALAKKIIRFALYQNCDKCTPCREGIYRLWELFSQKNLDQNTLKDIFQVLDETSYCPLGIIAGRSISTLFAKIINAEKN